MPFSIVLSEFLLIEMAKDTRHGNIALAPWLTKIEVEIVVLHISITINAPLQSL